MSNEFDGNITISVVNITPNGRTIVAAITWPNHRTKRGGDEDMFSIDDLNKLDEVVDVRRVRRFRQMERIRFDRQKIDVADVWLFPEDNLHTFGKKIYHATRIPTYRQHIWFETEEHEIVSPLFDTTINGVVEQIDITKIFDREKMLYGLPIDSMFYESRADIVIKSDEMITTLADVYAAYGGKIKWFVADINDFFQNKEVVSNSIQNDKYMFDLIYYGFVFKYWPRIPFDIFHLFINDEADIFDHYPNMEISHSTLSKSVILETTILSKNYMPTLPDNTQFGLFESEIILVSSITDTIIDVGNIFNAIKLSSDVPYSAGRIIVSDKLISVEKQLVGDMRKPSQKIHIPVDTVVFMIVVPNECDICIFIGSDGKLSIKSFWVAQKMFGLNHIGEYAIRYVNPLIEQINKHSSLIRPFDMFTGSNHITKSIQYKISLKKKLTHNNILALKNTLENFRSANIFQPISAGQDNISFRVVKGVNKFDLARFWRTAQTSNYFNFATNGHVYKVWESVFINNKKCEIIARAIDTIIIMTNLFDDEMVAAMRYVLMFLSGDKVQQKNVGPDDDDRSNTKKLIVLKTTDPILFDIRKLYGTPKTYSQVCQNHNQPSIVAPNAKGAVKYWNFTENKEQYFRCDSSTYGQFYFKTGIHPLGYCLPCCKKASLNESSKFETINKECFKNHKYVVGNRNTTKSKYVVSYGKYLEDNRLAHLPDKSLEQIFYLQHEKEYIGFYIIGTPQNIKNTSNVGMLVIALNILAKTVDEFAIDISNTNNYDSLLNGELSRYFKKKEMFVGELMNVFVGGQNSEFTKWNECAIDILKYVYGIIVIQFEDIGSTIHLKIPSEIKQSNEYISQKYKYVFVIHRTDTFYPIYLVEKISKASESNHIVKSVFSVGDQIMSTMLTVVDNLLEASSSSAKMLIDNILHVGKKIDQIIVSTKGIGIGVLIDGIYLPIHHTNVDMLDIDKTTELPSREQMASVDDVLTIIINFGIRDVASWLKMVDGRYIGFVADGLYFHTKIFDTLPSRSSNEKYISMMYDPLEINKIIQRGLAPDKSKFGNLNQKMFNKQSYKIFVLNFIAKMKTLRNEKIRSLLYEKIGDGIASIKNILADWVSDFEYIEYIAHKMDNAYEMPNEYAKMSGYKNSKKTPDEILAFVKKTSFRFDDVPYFELLALSLDDVKKKIKEILPVVFDSPVAQTSEIIICANGQADYCRDGALVIEQTTYEKYVDILANDLKNPIKQKSIHFFISGSDTLRIVNHENEIIKMDI
jgi:hypothetical protein